MAPTKDEDFVSGRRALEARRMVDVVKLAIWTAGTVLPWAAIVIAARWVATVLT